MDCWILKRLVIRGCVARIEGFLVTVCRWASFVVKTTERPSAREAVFLPVLNIHKHMRTMILSACFLLFAAFCEFSHGAPFALGTAFRYQGSLQQGSERVNGIFDMYFELYDAPAGGTFLRAVEIEEVEVTNGLFHVDLDFGAGMFNGQARWLQISVEGFSLAPRQPLTPVPYSILGATVPDGSITTSKLAAGAVSSSNLAPASVNGTALATDIVLGGPGRGEATLDLMDGNIRIMRLDAEDRRIEVSNGAGRQGALLGAGSLQLLTGASNNATAVHLSAFGALGGYLSLNSSNGTPALTLAATDSSVGGKSKITTHVLQITGGADLSEQFHINGSESAIQPGMVVCIDAENPGQLTPSRQAYDRRVAGIVSGAGGVDPGMLMAQEGSLAAGKHPVALTGRVYCWVDASRSPVRCGDTLTTSNTPGHAMAVTDFARAHGAILGKAMTALPEGKGLVLVLVSLQ